MLLLAAGMTGCIKSDNELYEKIKRVQPGSDIYSVASRQSEMSLDAATVGIRFAILLSEADKQGKRDDLIHVEGSYEGSSANLFARYFSSSAKLGTAEESTSYRLTFDASAGTIDIFQRTGVYLIDTKGLLLEETDSTTPWEVTVASDEMLLTSSSVGRVALYPEWVMQLYRSGSSYVIQVNGFVSRVAGADPVSPYASNWNLRFVVSPQKEESNWSFSSVFTNTFEFYGTAEGETCYTYNNQSCAAMDYSVSSVDPLTYKPRLSPVYAIAGSETCELTRPSDYDATYFVSPKVTYKWSLSSTNVLSYTIFYNGYQETF